MQLCNSNDSVYTNINALDSKIIFSHRILNFPQLFEVFQFQLFVYHRNLHLTSWFLLFHRFCIVVFGGRTDAVDPFSGSLWFVVAQFIALSSGIFAQFWHESQFCVSLGWVYRSIWCRVLAWHFLRILSAIKLRTSSIIHRYEGNYKQIFRIGWEPNLYKFDRRALVKFQSIFR